MIHRLSELLTQYFMKYGQATDKAEVYIYGIECFISEFIIINCSDTLAPDLSYDHMDAQLSLDTNTTWRIPL